MASFDIGKIAVLLVTLGTLISSGSRGKSTSSKQLSIYYTQTLHATCSNELVRMMIYRPMNSQIDTYRDF